MKPQYVMSIDQSTQGTKAMLFDGAGNVVGGKALPHRQLISGAGWVSHDLNEILAHTIQAAKLAVAEAGIEPADIAYVGISNQRETTAMWERGSGVPLCEAVVWQCGRAGEIVRQLNTPAVNERVTQKTGIPLSAYFPAAKMAWLLRSASGNMARARRGEICLGTIDSWLVYSLTREHAFKTDCSNASRTQLMNLQSLAWDADIAALFDIPMCCLAEICDSDALYGHTDMGGLFATPVPICAVLGDSHASLFGHGCLKRGMCKTTYGTGSSIMLNIGAAPVRSAHGLVTSIAWKRGGQVEYVLEGNLNYTGAVISWLRDNVGLISSPDEAEALARTANPLDKTYLVPAFTGLGAPYWAEYASAAIYGMTRVTGRAELVRAALDCIAYQIADVIFAMERDTGIGLAELRIDGGGAKNAYLAQFQSDILAKRVSIPRMAELSSMGAAYMAGLSSGMYSEPRLFGNMEHTVFAPNMDAALRTAKYSGWQDAVARVLMNGDNVHE